MVEFFRCDRFGELAGVEKSTLRDFYEAFPERFSNKTNGVKPRRWMMLANPSLCGLIDETIGTKWHTELEELRALEPFAEDRGFLETWRKTISEAKISNPISGLSFRRSEQSLR